MKTPSVGPQRRTATFLFTDIVGSTERWERDAVDMRAALALHEELLRVAIEASGGEVFKTVGDAFHAVFTTATAAIQAAVAGTRALSTEDWSGEPVEVRMAVYTGEAEAVADDWLGRPLNRCARLLAAAGGGQILVSNTTARLADTDLGADIHLVELGTYRFRGVARAERVFQVVAPGLVSEFGPLVEGEPQDDTEGRRSVVPRDPALPSSLAGHAATMWVGRDAELEILRSAWEGASSGTSRTVLIAGEPGAGKTALATRFAAEAAQRGAWVLHGHCDEEALLPYHAFAEALEQLVASAEGSLLAAHTADHGGDLCSMVPLLARRVPGLRPTMSTTPEADRGRLAMAAIGLLEAGARNRPIVVVLDDLHWADSGTVGLLRELVRRAPSVALLVVATYRSTDVDREQPSARLFADLRRETGVARIALVGLSEGEVSGLVCGLAGRPLDDEAQAFAASLRRDTNGNPFFIIEVLHHLVETGALELGDGHWSLDATTAQIPEGIREVVGNRLDRLGTEGSEMLRTAAVIGPRFDLQVVAEVLAVSHDAVLATLEAASAADLVAEAAGAVDSWQFTHELVRRTLVDQLSLSRRARTHRAVGEAIERVRPGELAALAHHFAASAGLGDVNRAVEYACAAADQAASRAGHADAARLLERGMNAAEDADGLDDARRIELLTRIGSETAKAGEAAAAGVHLDRAISLARSIASPELLAEAVLARTSYSWSFDEDSDPRALVSEALATEPLSARTRARLLAALAAFGAYSVEPLSRKRADVSSAIAAAREVGDPETLAAALVASANLGSGPDQVSARRSELDELVSASQTANRPDWEATAWGFHVDRHLTLGEYDLARGAERELERVATETRDPYALLLLDEVVSRRACINGDFALAERLAGEQTSLGARLGASAGAMMIPAAGLCVPIWNLQGRLDELEQFLGLAPSTGEWEQMHALWTGSVRARQGRLDDAGAAISGCGLPIERGRSWGVGVADATTAITRLNDRALAEQLLGELEPYHHLDCVFDFLQYRGAVVHHTGRLLITCERFEDAAEDLAEAGERYERLASPPWQALARRDLARAFRGRARPGDEELAIDLESHVRRETERLGMA